MKLILFFLDMKHVIGTEAVGKNTFAGIYVGSVSLATRWPHKPHKPQNGVQLHTAGSPGGTTYSTFFLLYINVEVLWTFLHGMSILFCFLSLDKLLYNLI